MRPLPAALALLLATPLAAAQPVPSPPAAATPTSPALAPDLDLDRARALADARAPDRLVAEARAAVAHRDVAVAGMPTNPTVTVGSAYNTAHFYTALSIPLPLFGQLGAAMDVARADARAADVDVNVVRLDVRLGATLAWTDLWLAQREAAVARETAERNERLVTVTEARLGEGAAPRLDVVRARAEALRTRAEAEAAQGAVASAAARLSAWLGESATAVDPTSLRAQGDPPEPPAPAALATLLPRVENHPVYLAARARQGAASANVSLEQRRRWPWVGLEVGGAFFDPSLAAAGQNTPAFSDAHVALSVEVPVLHAHGPLIARARAAESQSSQETLAARARLAAEVAAAYGALQAAEARAAAQLRDVLPATQEAADLATESYREGRTDINGVLAAAQALTDAQVTAARLIAERTRAQANLEHALGSTL